MATAMQTGAAKRNIKKAIAARSSGRKPTRKAMR
jgi:hypothetical protein